MPPVIHIPVGHGQPPSLWGERQTLLHHGELCCVPGDDRAQVGVEVDKKARQVEMYWSSGTSREHPPCTNEPPQEWTNGSNNHQHAFSSPAGPEDTQALFLQTGLVEEAGWSCWGQQWGCWPTQQEINSTMHEK